MGNSYFAETTVPNMIEIIDERIKILEGKISDYDTAQENLKKFQEFTTEFGEQENSRIREEGKFEINEPIEEEAPEKSTPKSKGRIELTQEQLDLFGKNI